jgi:signal peptidase II
MASPARAPLAPGGAGFWALLVSVLVLDVLTKAWAVRNLVPRHVPHEIIGEYVRFTLSYNPGAAFGMHIGEYSRWFFGVLAIVIIVVLLRTTRELVATSRLASIGVPVVIGGAVGNLLDRIRYPDGVVDFIDIGIGTVRFWTFNVADTAVSIGAVCLVLALWGDERREAARREGRA